jgi:hypothetical protein
MERWNLRIAKASLLAVAVLAVLAIGSGLGISRLSPAPRRACPCDSISKRAPGRNVRQNRVQIRGEDRGNPVILFVHGGRGGRFRLAGSHGKSISPSFNGTKVALDALFVKPANRLRRP